MQTLAHIDLDAIRSRVSILDILRESDAKVRRQRADCPICNHFHRRRTSQKFTLSFTRECWYCHRCAEGGGIFELWQLVHGVDFKTSLRALATMAGISATATDRAVLQQERAARELKKAEDAEAAERLRCARLKLRDELHCLEECRRLAIEHIREPEHSEVCWRILSVAEDELRDVLAAYWLLSFGTGAEQSRFLCADEPGQAEIIAQILAKGFIATDGEVAKYLEVSL